MNPLRLSRKALAGAVCALLMVLGAVWLANQAVVSIARHQNVIAEMRASQSRLATQLARPSSTNPSVQTLNAVAAEARLLASHVGTLNGPEARHVEAQIDVIMHSADELLLKRIGSGDPAVTSSRLIDDMRRAEGSLDSSLSALERDLASSYWLNGALIAGGLVLALAGGVITSWIRRNLTGPAARLADTLDHGIADAPVSAERREPLTQRWRRYRQALQAARQVALAPLAVRHRVLDALPANIALLDRAGMIIHVNDRWRAFASHSENAVAEAHAGANYLAVSEADPNGDGRWVAARLREILAGTSHSFGFEYPCRTPDGDQWFRMLARSVAAGEGGHADVAAVVMHIDITEQKRAEQQLSHLAYVDRLTGLCSRTGLMEQLDRALPQLPVGERRVLIVLDVRDLRSINETYGYETGDELLVEIGTTLQQALAENECTARLGGDQFAVYLDPNAHWLDSSEVEEGVTGWIDRVLGRSFDASGYPVDIGMWIGVSVVHASDDAADSIRRAALATHMARKRPFARCLVYDQELDARVRERARITRALHQALAEDKFELYYQPNVDMANGTIQSSEALIRWRDPVHGLQAPNYFIPVAETSRLIVPIGEWTIHAACRQLRAWHDVGITARTAVNVSRVQFAHSDVAACVKRALRDTRIDPDSLIVEVTESAFEENTDHLIDQLEQLHALGVNLALDDFGTGYSSLKYLQQCPFDVIKLDMRFTQHVTEERYSHEIVRMVQVLAGALNARVVAEGVETTAQRDELLALGCTNGQGFYYAKAMPADALETLLMGHVRLPVPKQSDREYSNVPRG